MNNKSKKRYKYSTKEVSINEHTFKPNHFESHDGRFSMWGANYELCESCTRLELYIKALRAGVRAHYNADTLYPIYDDACLVRDRINYIIDQIESNIISCDPAPTSEDLIWYAKNWRKIVNLTEIEHWLYSPALPIPHITINGWM